MRADVYWIPETQFGRLALMSRPRSGDWLEDEIKAWRKEQIDLVVSLLTSKEIFELELQAEQEICNSNQIDFISFPICDREVPSSTIATINLVEQIQTLLVKELGVGIHCRMGVGRSALISACVLKRQGFTTEEAYSFIQKARGIKVPDTDEQVAWVENFETLETNHW